MGIFSHDATDDVIVSASFPDSNPFGLVVNGEQNALAIHLANAGKKNYTLVSAGGSFHDPTNHWALVKNTSTLKYNVPLVAGANFSAPYSVYSEYRPNELGLTVWVDVAETGGKDLHRITALNQTISIVEPAHSWFDLQLLFLYLVLGTALLGGAYAAYKAFLAPTSTKSRGKTGRSGEKKVKAVVPASPGKQYPEVKPYEEEWIPETHLKHRQSKLKKRGGKDGGASSAGEEVLSGGEVTSGGEASGTEGKAGKRKGKKA